MEIKPIHGNVIGLDIHQKQVTACAITVSDAGSVDHQFKEFGTFMRDCRELVAWAEQMQPDVVVMESTGIYWKSVHRALCRAGMTALVVNARHVKQVPGRKTDIADSLWLAMLARAGLLRGSFVISEDLDALRLVARQRQKLVGMLASEKNRLHKVLTDAGVRLPSVVSDVHGQAARRMTECLIAGGTAEEALAHAGSRLKASREELLGALDGELTPVHRFVLREVLDHIYEIEAVSAVLTPNLFVGSNPMHGRFHFSRRFLESTPSGRPCSWSKSGWIWRSSATRWTGWLLGSASARATMNRRANEKVAEPAREIVGFAVCYARWPTPPAAPGAYSRANTRGLSFAGDTSG